MKKEEILNASRKEHRNKDLAEMEMKRKSDLVLSVLFFILAILAFVGFVCRLLEVRV